MQCLRLFVLAAVLLGATAFAPSRSLARTSSCTFHTGLHGHGINGHRMASGVSAGADSGPKSVSSVSSVASSVASRVSSFASSVSSMRLRTLSPLAILLTLLGFSKPTLAAAKGGTGSWGLYGRVPHDDWLFTTARLASPSLLKRSIVEAVGAEIPYVLPNFKRRRILFQASMGTKTLLGCAVAGVLLTLLVRLGRFKKAQRLSDQTQIRGFETPVSAAYKKAEKRGREVEGMEGWVDMNRVMNWEIEQEKDRNWNGEDEEEEEPMKGDKGDKGKGDKGKGDKGKGGEDEEDRGKDKGPKGPSPKGPSPKGPKGAGPKGPKGAGPKGPKGAGPKGPKGPRRDADDGLYDD